MTFKCVSVLSHTTSYNNLTCKEWEDAVTYSNIIYLVHMARAIEKIREERCTGQFHHLLANGNRFFSREVGFCDTGTIKRDSRPVIVIECILVVLVKDKFLRFITRILSFPLLFYEV